MEHADSGAVSRRSHHISSIAHLFLGDGHAPDAGEPLLDIRRCAVAAPGGAAISAFAAAGLVLGSPGSSLLSEDVLVRWSAGTYFDPGSEAVRARAGTDDDGRNTWTVFANTDHPSSTGRERTSGPTPAPEIHWNHLGCLGPVQLAHLESLATAQPAGSAPAVGSQGLVWCLREDEAGSLKASYFLGRLAEVLQPCRIEILLFPNAWSSAGRPGWLDEIRNVASLRYDSENLAPVAMLAKKACGGISLGIHQVAGADNLAANFAGARAPGSLWGRVAQAMVSGLAEC